MVLVHIHASCSLLVRAVDCRTGCFNWRLLLPGIREAVVLFSTYCALEWVYNKTIAKKPANGYAQPATVECSLRVHFCKSIFYVFVAICSR